MIDDDFEDENSGKNLPAKMDVWPVGLSMDMSFITHEGRPFYTDEDLCQKYELTQAKLDLIRKLPAFQTELAQCRKESEQTNGTVIKKAALHTEYYISELVPQWMADDKQPLQAKVQVLQFLAKIGRLDGSTEKLAQLEDAVKKGALSGPSLVINLTPPTPPQNPPFTIDMKKPPKDKE